MTSRSRWNWPIWLALPLSVVTLFSYPFVFVRWPITRDVPWVNILLGAAALAAAGVGLKRAFGEPRRWISKSVSVVVALLSVFVVVTFVNGVIIAPRRLPASAGAPQIGQRAPDFSLSDLDGRRVSLSSLLSTPLSDGGRTRGVLLIFYRGYW
jgi:hypothetical protein